jgi:AraC-like DNA-binding protein
VKIAHPMVARVNRCSFPRVPVTCAGTELLTIWEVQARAGYNVGGEGARHDSHVRITKGGQNCVALRTIRGAGRLRISGKEFEVTESSLLLFDFRALENHGASGKSWDFWWFEFRPVEPIRLPMLTVMRAPMLETEEENCRGIFESLRSENLAERCAANAELQSMLYRWWAASGGIGEPAESRAEAAVRRLIDTMHRMPERPWTVLQMAQIAGMSISSLRAAFQKATGKSPARVRNSLRLAHAYERLRTARLTVAEVADEMGFCDPFHFSKTFRREFGFPPSSLRGKEPTA